ncbi:hypothetical protein NC651_005060 [Populus alba x Populus x berolinensis]|nr:hypothetical protein NC651_005060 [Populus alba x Populus x berolinensis]
MRKLYRRHDSLGSGNLRLLKTHRNPLEELMLCSLMRGLLRANGRSCILSSEYWKDFRHICCFFPKLLITKV